MKIEIQNITWNFQKIHEYADDFLGSSEVGIPENMMKRFVKECRWDEDLKVPPHYYEEDLENYGPFTSDHNCNNANTQIVLMNWLHDKRRKYKLDYRGTDPFWVFHDHKHSQSDVYGYEVNVITSYIEYERILEGGEMAKDCGFAMKPETALEIYNAWEGRFPNPHQKLNLSDFEPLLKNNLAINQMYRLEEYGFDFKYR